MPTVLTVHDLAILRSPEAFPHWHRLYGSRLPRVLRSADAIVAVSEFTKAETVDLAGVPPERIRVIPNGVDAVFDAEGGAPTATTCSRSRHSSLGRTSGGPSRQLVLRESSCA